MTQVKLVRVNKDDDGIRLDRWFKRHYPNVLHVSIEKALRKGQIKVDGKRAKSSDRLEKGQEIRVPPLNERTGDDRIVVVTDVFKEYLQKLVIYKDNDIIAINKPSGLAVQGGSKVKESVDAGLDALKFDYDERPKLVHRIDKDTSGVLVLARKTNIAAKLTEAFRTRAIEKVYYAIVVGKPDVEIGEIDLPLLLKGENQEKVEVDERGGQKSLTRYRVLDSAFETASLIELHPITGRKHQLRVHMSAIGYPILGDGKYGGKEAFLGGLSNQLHLHAHEIFIRGVLAKDVHIKAELSEHFKESVKHLGLNEK